MKFVKLTQSELFSIFKGVQILWPLLKHKTNLKKIRKFQIFNLISEMFIKFNHAKERTCDDFIIFVLSVS